MHKPTFSTMTISYYSIIFLLLLTPVLLIWQYFGMTRIIEISPRQPYGVRVIDDHDTAKGNTVTTLERTEDAFIMRCKLGAATEYPYCKLQFLLGAGGKGVDLTGFETITFRMRYSEPYPESIKLHLLNFEP